jgi:hypothetical protein
MAFFIVTTIKTLNLTKWKIFVRKYSFLNVRQHSIDIEGLRKALKKHQNS